MALHAFRSAMTDEAGDIRITHNGVGINLPALEVRISEWSGSRVTLEFTSASKQDSAVMYEAIRACLRSGHLQIECKTKALPDT